LFTQLRRAAAAGVSGGGARQNFQSAKLPSLQANGVTTVVNESTRAYEATDAPGKKAGAQDPVAQPSRRGGGASAAGRGGASASAPAPQQIIVATLAWIVRPYNPLLGKRHICQALTDSFAEARSITYFA